MDATQGPTVARWVSKKTQQTYNFFALFDTGFDLWNISLGDIIFLLYLVFAEDL